VFRTSFRKGGLGKFRRSWGKKKRGCCKGLPKLHLLEGNGVWTDNLGDEKNRKKSEEKFQGGGQNRKLHINWGKGLKKERTD